MQTQITVLNITAAIYQSCIFIIAIVYNYYTCIHTLRRSKILKMAKILPELRQTGNAISKQTSPSTGSPTLCNHSNDEFTIATNEYEQQNLQLFVFIPAISFFVECK